MKGLAILVVAHKPFTPETNKPPYKTIFVGKAHDINKNVLYDNTRDNISNKNNTYCELTAMYWAWKNLKVQNIGINHYRRYFAEPNLAHQHQATLDNILTESTAKELLKSYDIIVPKKKIVPSFNVYTHYNSHHYKQDLDITRNIIKEVTPEYITAFDHTMRQHSLYLCNMVITRKEIYNQYCLWLFTILNKIEKEVDLTTYSITQQRVFGFLAERLFNVWLNYHKEYSIKELNLLSLEEKIPINSIINGISRRIKGQKL